MKKTANQKNKKKELRSIPYSLAEKAFWIFLFLFSSSAFLIFFLLYQPIKNQKEAPADIKNTLVQFDEETFQNVLSQWKIKKEKVEMIEQKSYPDIFTKKDSPSQSEAPTSSNASSTPLITQNPETGPATGSAYEITIDFAACQPQRKTAYVSFGSTVYEITGRTGNTCEMNYGGEVEDPEWDGKMTTTCWIPISLGKLNFKKTDYGVDFSPIKKYCVDISSSSSTQASTTSTATTTATATSTATTSNP